MGGLKGGGGEAMKAGEMDSLAGGKICAHETYKSWCKNPGFSILVLAAPNLNAPFHEKLVQTRECPNVCWPWVGLGGGGG